VSLLSVEDFAAPAGDPDHLGSLIKGVVGGAST
jgi:hypothetical protein